MVNISKVTPDVDGFFPKGVTVNKRCAGFPTSVRGVGWGYPAKGAEG